jgi:hypothetical protein
MTMRMRGSATAFSIPAPYNLRRKSLGQPGDGCLPEFVVEFAEVITAIENDEDVRVVVFDSAAEGFFLNHSDFTVPLEDLTGLLQGLSRLRSLFCGKNVLRKF